MVSGPEEEMEWLSRTEGCKGLKQMDQDLNVGGVSADGTQT